MKVLSTEQIREADRLTIEKQQISSVDLMERAALKVFEWMQHHFKESTQKIHIFCGVGNNGGDGLALARHLNVHGYTVAVYVVNFSENRSNDFMINLNRLKAEKLWPDFLNETHYDVKLSSNDIIIDAIFGIGLSRPPAGWVGSLIEKINQSKAFILSIDMPSGLFMNNVPKFFNRIIRADHVLTFQCPKLPFFLPQTGCYVKQWEVLDIELDATHLTHLKVDYVLTDIHKIHSLYRMRSQFSHKGTYGHALIIGGSYGKIGAVSLAAKACLHVGAGLVSCYIPKCGYLPIQTNLYEVMVLTDSNDDHLSDIIIPFKPKVIGIGIGMGVHTETKNAFERFLTKNTAPLVIDADALNLLSQHVELLKKLPKHSVLTPHPKELERLIGSWKDDFEKLAMAKQFSSDYQCILVIKGAYTIILANGVGFINPTGNPGMATGGSGDVLTGVITGLIAQGYQPVEAAIFGVYLHGLSGDIAASKNGYEAVTASKLIDNLSSSFIKLFGKVQ